MRSSCSVRPSHFIWQINLAAVKKTAQDWDFPCAVKLPVCTTHSYIFAVTREKERLYGLFYPRQKHSRADLPSSKEKKMHWIHRILPYLLAILILSAGFVRRHAAGIYSVLGRKYVDNYRNGYGKISIIYCGK